MHQVIRSDPAAVWDGRLENFCLPYFSSQYQNDPMQDRKPRYMNPYTDFGFNEIPAILKEPIFERAFRTSEVSAMSREEYDIYMESLMSYWESQGMLDTARTEAEIKGRIEEKVEVALNGIRLGLPNETIQELTGLSEAEIKKLRTNRS